nr:DENN domain-containing protein 4B-like [Chelonoidis abingdonii]
MGSAGRGSAAGAGGQPSHNILEPALVFPAPGPAQQPAAAGAGLPAPPARAPGNSAVRPQSWRCPSSPFSLAFLEAVLSHVGLGEMHKAIALFLQTLAAEPSPPHLQRSVYREILFLMLAALGRDHVDIAAFDKKYKAAYTKVASSLGKEELSRRRAQPPSSKAIDCRRSFGATLEC